MRSDISQTIENLDETRGGKLGILLAREHPLSTELHSLTIKSELSK